MLGTHPLISDDVTGCVLKRNVSRLELAVLRLGTAPEPEPAEGLAPLLVLLAPALPFPVGDERNFSMCLIRSATEIIGFSMFWIWGTIGPVCTGSGCSNERLRIMAPLGSGSRSPNERRLAGESVFRMDRFSSSESECSSRLLLREDFRMGRISSDSDEYFFLRMGFGVGSG